MEQNEFEWDLWIENEYRLLDPCNPVDVTLGDIRREWDLIKYSFSAVSC